MTIRKILSASLLSIALSHIGLAMVMPAHAETPPPLKIEVKKDPAWIVLLRIRYDLYARWKADGKWPDDKEANAALEAHGHYWKQKQEEGVLILAGGMDGDYWDNAAQIIFRAADKASADAIVAADPAVKAYVFEAQVRPFTISRISASN